MPDEYQKVTVMNAVIPVGAADKAAPLPVKAAETFPISGSVKVAPAEGLLFAEFTGAPGQVFFTAPPNTAWEVWVQMLKPSHPTNFVVRIGRGMFYGYGGLLGIEDQARKLTDEQVFGHPLPLVSGEPLELKIPGGTSKWYIQVIQR